MRIRFIFRFSLTAAFLFASPDLIAQSKKDSLVAEKINLLQKIFEKNQSLTSSKIQQGYLINAQKFFSNPAPSQTDVPYLNNVIDQEIKQFKKNPGLEFNSSFMQNFKSAPSDEDLIYRQRLQAGLDWNLLKNGLGENSINTQRAAIQKSINTLHEKYNTKTKELSFRTAEIIYRFNAEKIRLLKKRKEILDSKTELIMQLYNLNELSNLEYIHLKQSLVDVSSTIDIYDSYNEIFKHEFKPDSLEPITLPLIDFAFDAFLKNYSALGQQEDSLIKLNLRDLDLQRSAVNNISLKATGRYNYYDVLYSPAAGNFFSAGLSLSIPLSSPVSKPLASAKAELIKHKLSSNNTEELAEMMNYFYEFRYKLKQYLDLHEKSIEWSELLRIERVRMQYHDAEFNPVKSLKLLDELLDQRIELIDIKQQLYLKLIQISKYNASANIGDYISQVQLDSVELAAVSFSYEKTVYAWGTLFENTNATFVSEYLLKNSVSNIIVSVNADAPEAGLNALETFSNAGIKTEMLISNNDLINKNDADIQRYFNKIIIASKKQAYNTIHIDIEPHTFADWKEKKSEYKKKYIHMLQVIKKICNSRNIYLAVSVSLNYDAAFIRDINDLSNKMYVMAYETKNQETVIRKLKENFSSASVKLIIALRVNDFNSTNELDSYIKTVSEKTGIHRFAIHDLTRLMKLQE